MTWREFASVHLGVRAVTLGALAMLGTSLLIGIPSDVIPNPWFAREIGVDGFDVFTLVCLSALTGALAATYVVARGPTVAASRSGFGSGVLGFFAISCPVCNKAVVALVGTAGASGWFASIQPLLGALAIVLAAVALIVRVRAIRRGMCPVRPSPSQPQSSAGLRADTNST